MSVRHALRAATILATVAFAVVPASAQTIRYANQGVLNSLDPIDREVLTLRHFEELSNGETAQVLGISKSAASNRYIRALLRLKETLSSMPGFFDA